MRISIISNGYAYQETINRIEKTELSAEEKEALKTSNSAGKTEDFEEVLKSIQDMIKEKFGVSSTAKTYANPVLVGAGPTASGEASSTEKASALPPYTGKIPEISSYQTADKITVPRSTTAGYESIAPMELQDIFKEAAETFGIDQKLLELIGYHESRFLANETSSSGAMGIMQLMPDTANTMGVVNAYDARENIMGGARLLSQLYNDYYGDLDLMLAGYSAGQGAVRRYEGVPPFEETLNYIDWVRERYP